MLPELNEDVKRGLRKMERLSFCWEIIERFFRFFAGEGKNSVLTLRRSFPLMCDGKQGDEKNGDEQKWT